MKVIFATGLRTEMGGGAKYALQLQTEFAKKGISSEAVPYTSLELALPIGVRHVVYFFRFLMPLMRADVAFAFDTWSVGLPSLVAAKLLRKPFVVRVGGDFLWEHYVERTGDLVKLSEIYDSRRERFSLKEKLIYRGTRFLLRHADVVACNSQWQIDLWHRVYGLPLARARVIENVYLPHAEGVPPKKKNFVAAGRSIQLKQEPLLEDVFAEVRKEYADVELDMRSLPPEEHQKRVASCYAVVLASVSDVAPNVIIDAIRYGKPFICTSDTGIKERVGSLGLFVDTGNREALTASIISLLDPQMYEQKARASAAFSFERSWSVVADDFVAVLKQCVS